MATIAVTGSSGLIGGALVASLAERGDHVIRLVRRPVSNPDEVRWDPAAGTVDAVENLDAVVNLAGAPIARPWTRSHRVDILTSRLAATRTASELASRLGAALVNGSAVGYYGSDRGAEVLTEASSSGDSFLADVVRQWEAATAAAREAGCRVALARTGIVLAHGEGALKPLELLTRVGLGGPMGGGNQTWPWITLTDEVGALVHLIDHEVEGPVNLAAPDARTQGEIVRALAAKLKRPAVVKAPGFALKAVLGGFADDILGSQHVVPTRLLETGYTFTHPTLASAIDWLVQPQPTR